MGTRSYGWGLGLLVAIAALALLASLLIGPADLSPGRALAALSGGGDEMARTIMGAVRVPRSLSAFAVGSLLALAGVLLQALFRNPLADPFVLGVSGGAAVGALAGMLAGAGIALLHWYATAGAFAVGALVLLIGRTSDTTRLLLAGVVLASACGAVISVLLSIAGTGQLRGMVFWLAGDLSWSERPEYDLAVAALALSAAVLLGRVLNVLASDPPVDIPDRLGLNRYRRALGRTGRLCRPGGTPPGAPRIQERGSSHRGPGRSALWWRFAVRGRCIEPHRRRPTPAADRRGHGTDRCAGIHRAAAPPAQRMSAPGPQARRSESVRRPRV
jgi:FecCD transport family